MDKRQKYGILSEELIRRLSNISTGNREKEEVVRVTNEYTVQLRQSGYKCEEARKLLRVAS